MAGMAAAAVLVLSPLNIYAAEVGVQLPSGWASSTTDDGREYYYNVETKESQYTLPDGAVESGKARAKRISDQNNLNKVVPFDALPAVPVDRVSVYKTPELTGGCGDEDYRVNSVECGSPAKNLIEDVAEKTVGAMPILGDLQKESAKAVTSAERGRMLQQAELKALQKTDLFKKLDSQTKDPEKMAERKKQIDEITARNDIGSQRAPWMAERDYTVLSEEDQAKRVAGLVKIQLPKLQLPNPFGAAKSNQERETPAAKASKSAPAASPGLVAGEDEDEDE